MTVNERGEAVFPKLGTIEVGAITIGATASTVNDGITISNNDLIDDGSIYLVKANNVTIDHNLLSDTNTVPAPVAGM